MYAVLTQLVKNFDAKASVKDADAKLGVVTGYLSCFGNKDSDGDVIVKGAFAKTIQENGPQSSQPRIKHLLDHNTRQALGVFQVLKEDDYGLYYESKIGSHQLGVDFLKMAESGLITEHSIGYRIIKGEWEENPVTEDRSYRLLELQLYEGSSLQFWGANPMTPLTGIKSEGDLMNLFSLLEKALKTGTYTDQTFALLQKHYDAIGVALTTRRPTEPVLPTQPETPAIKAAELVAKHFNLTL